MGGFFFIIYLTGKHLFDKVKIKKQVRHYEDLQQI